MWGHESLEGRRTPDVNYFDLPPKPAPAPKGASAVEKARAKKALKAYNKAMRPAQGTALHAIFESYYLQKVRGAWHPPMAWRGDLAAAWHSRPGQIALSGRSHLPNPEDLAAVWVEELVTVDLSFLPGEASVYYRPGPHPDEYWEERLLIGGTPDLVTLRVCRGVDDFIGDRPEDECTHWYDFHLYDYKSTISIDDYAKTPAELLEDEQAAIYSLAVMQKHGLESLDCTWVYFQTDETKPPRSMPVHFTMSRAHAEEVVARIAQRAATMAEVQARYLAERPGLLGRRLEVLKDLDTNDMACDNFGGCVFHAKRPGGFCKPKKSSLGEALNKLSAEKKKTTARREAGKAAKAADQQHARRNIMALTAEQSARMAELVSMKATEEAAGKKLVFKLGQELLKLQKLAGDEGPAASEPAGGTVETTGTAAADDRPPTKPADPVGTKAEAQAKKAAAKTDDGAVTCTALGYTLELPQKSPLYKAIVKACKAQQAADAAIMGELG